MLVLNVGYVEAEVLINEEIILIPLDKKTREFELMTPINLSLGITVDYGFLESVAIYEFQPGGVNPRDFLGGGNGTGDKFFKEKVGNETFTIEFEESGFYKIEFLSTNIMKVKVILRSIDDDKSDSLTLRNDFVGAIGALILFTMISKRVRYPNRF